MGSSNKLIKLEDVKEGDLFAKMLDKRTTSIVRFVMTEEPGWQRGHVLVRRNFDYDYAIVEDVLTGKHYDIQIRLSPDGKDFYVGSHTWCPVSRVSKNQVEQRIGAAHARARSLRAQAAEEDQHAANLRQFWSKL